MEELKEAARCYSTTASGEYHRRARRALDNGESAEDFYVRETKRSIRRCNVCAKLVVGFYFCCTKCELYKGCNYNLCVKCFYGGTFQHEHDSFADNHSVLMMHNEGRSEPSCVIEKDKGKGKQSLPIVAKQSYTRSHAETKTLVPYLNDSSTSNSRRSSLRSLTDSSISNSLPLIPSLNDSSISNLRRSFRSLSDSSHFNSLLTIPSLKDSSISTSRRTLSRDSSHSNSRRSLSERKIMVDKAGIEKLAIIAKAHYNAAPQKIRNSADEFFWSMVKQNGKTSVTMNEFLESMNEKRHGEYAIPELFQILVKDTNVGMSKSECRTLYYILLSGRPFCSWCNCFIADIYFCCSKCSAKKYALCLYCYKNTAYVNHDHYGDNDVFFFDYTILHTTIKTDDNTKLKTAWTVVKAVLNVGGTVLSIASTFGACTIM